LGVQMKSKFTRCALKFVQVALGLSTLVCASLSGHAVDLSDKPLTTSTATAMRPNIMFVLDDSGSMGSDYMPDYVATGLCRGSDGKWKKACEPMDPPFFSAKFNGIYYQPLFSYFPAVNPDGSSKGDQFRLSGSVKKWDQIQKEPFLSPSTKVDLTQYTDILWCIKNNPSASEKIDPKYCRVNGPAYGLMSNPLGGNHAAVSAGYNYPNTVFTYDRDNSGNRFFVFGDPYFYTFTDVTWCKDSPGFLTCQARRDIVNGYKYAKYNGGTRFNISATACTPTCPISGRTYEAEMTNFANWYAYYRNRLNMMKTGVGRAFAGLDDSYRTGLMTIHTNGSSTSNYIQLKTNDSTQKTAWYNKLYAVNLNGGTPLREALSTAGQMYAGKTLVDPVQYSCQKNFTILSTDGFWNGAIGVGIDGAVIGNQDNNAGVTPRPKYDGGLLSTTEAGNGAYGGNETLSDVAMYYYKTDLRDSSLSNCVGALGAGSNVCGNNVSPTKKDPASHQHMTLFTIGLGVDGTLDFRQDYETSAVGDFNSIRTGAKSWPAPKNDDETAIDDLWHAAVNGGGTYYSAKNPQALSDGLGDALREVGTRTGAAAAASTSNPQVTTKDNYIFSANYRTAFWDSVIRRRRVNTNTGELEKQIDWEAGSILNTMVADTSDVRTIYMFSAGAANKLKSFEWSTLTAAEKLYLDVNSWSDPATKLSNWAGLNAIAQTAAKAPGALVKYLRGQTILEDDSGSADLPFRGRENVLGDVVNAETVYSKKSQFEYADAGHAAYATTTATRQGLLFAASNDGMLHAINSDTGREVWAYIPTAVIPNLYKLADKNYAHEFYVDGTPTLGDVFDGSSWRTILVGGLNKGGTGYYALDVTDPLAPKALWEICATGSGCSNTEANIGFSFGNPIISKLGNDWTVMFTSGYNNADGKGYLYVVNPITGAPKFAPIATSCTGANCGLSKISPWIEAFDNNRALRVYGGDLEGNMWRFDVNDTISPAGREAFKLAQAGNPGGGLIQSITTKPELGEVDGDAVVFFGTGRFIGVSDKADGTVNSFYAVKDDLSNTPLGNVRTNGKLIKQILTTGVDKQGRTVRTNSNNSVDWTLKSGWYLDFPTAGERSFTDPVLTLGTVTFTTNIPTIADPCSGGGISWIYHLSWKTGGAVITADKSSTEQLVSAKILANEFATRPIIVQLPNGKVVSITQTNLGDTVNAAGNEVLNSGMVVGPPFLIDSIDGKRAGWRQILE
jgi:type IV pilus assembly protein PilY1